MRLFTIIAALIFVSSTCIAQEDKERQNKEFSNEPIWNIFVTSSVSNFAYTNSSEKLSLWSLGGDIGYYIIPSTAIFFAFDNDLFLYKKPETYNYTYNLAFGTSHTIFRSKNSGRVDLVAKYGIGVSDNNDNLNYDYYDISFRAYVWSARKFIDPYIELGFNHKLMSADTKVDNLLGVYVAYGINL